MDKVKGVKGGWRMKEKVKKVKDYLGEKIDVTITPPIQYEVKSFSFHRKTLVIFILIFLFVFSSLGFMFNHYRIRYNNVSEELEEIENGELQELNNVYEENVVLKNQLYSLANDMVELNNKVREIQANNQKVRSVLAEEIEVEEVEKIPEENELSPRLQIMTENGELLQNQTGLGGNGSLNYFQPENLTENLVEDITRLEETINIQEKNTEKIRSSASEYEERRASIPSIWPVEDDGEGFISSNFGWRNSPTTGEREFHEGLDIGVWYGTPVLSAAEGRIIFAGWRSGYGYVVDIEHGYGYVTRYAHLQDIQVNEGEQVRRGEVIATSGNSGQSTGPHLHYEVIKDGVPQDPMEYIN